MERLCFFPILVTLAHTYENIQKHMIHLGNLLLRAAPLGSFQSIMINDSKLL